MTLGHPPKAFLEGRPVLFQGTKSLLGAVGVSRLKVPEAFEIPGVVFNLDGEGDFGGGPGSLQVKVGPAAPNT
jgi:hypothetical protein